jgi:hypothetical protein
VVALHLYVRRTQEQEEEAAAAEAARNQASSSQNETPASGLRDALMVPTPEHPRPADNAIAGRVTFFNDFKIFRV